MQLMKFGMIERTTACPDISGNSTLFSKIQSSGIQIRVPDSRRGKE
ncbi:hypothetical protein HY990_04610 [Candidatus Micrarchaeota archaeon]|nr:hypothetical protein [Candidatus Micrarchaeota archaeon]